MSLHRRLPAPDDPGALSEALADDTAYAARARALAEKTHELVEFLVRVRGVETVKADVSRGPAITIPVRRCASFR